KPFASYSKDLHKPLVFPRSTPVVHTDHLDADTIDVTRPIHLKGQLYGHVVLTATMSQLYERLFVYAFLYLAASIVVIGLSLPIVHRLRRQIVKAEERLDYFAFTDQVTGLQNRRAFHARLLE